MQLWCSTRHFTALACRSGLTLWMNMTKLNFGQFYLCCARQNSHQIPRTAASAHGPEVWRGPKLLKTTFSSQTKLQQQDIGGNKCDNWVPRGHTLHQSEQLWTRQDFNPARPPLPPPGTLFRPLPQVHMNNPLISWIEQWDAILSLHDLKLKI